MEHFGIGGHKNQSQICLIIEASEVLSYGQNTRNWLYGIGYASASEARNCLLSQAELGASHLLLRILIRVLH